MGSWPMGPEPRKLNDISLYKSLGIAFFETCPAYEHNSQPWLHSDILVLSIAVYHKW